jgi:ATPase subunit of ABC transporter with duplicated ATPase domains
MITLESLSKRFGPKILFEDVSMIFDPGKRYALVGANGAGKSTLLKVIAGEEESDKGTVSIPSRSRSACSGRTTSTTTPSASSTVMMGNKALWDAMQEKETSSSPAR